MVYVFLAPGFEEVEALTITDILRRGGVEVQLASISAEQQVAGAHGIRVQADLCFDQVDFQAASMLVLPGGMPGTTNLQASSSLCQELMTAAQEGKWVGAICAAPMVLGHLGLLEGKDATIYPGMEEELRGARPSKERVVIHDNIITSQAPGTAMEFALTLLQLLKGQEVKEDVEKGLIL